MARERPLEEMPEEFHARLKWLEGTMEGIAGMMFRRGVDAGDIFDTDFYGLQDQIARQIGLPENFDEFIELDMDVRTFSD